VKPEARASVPRLVAAAASGALLVLAFPPVEQHWVAFLWAVPLLVALRGGVRARAGFVLGLVAGFTFFGILLAWISTFGFLAWGLLTVLQALAVALFAAIAARTDRFGAVARLAGWPLLWGALEIARARYPFGGFAWGQLGVSQVDGGGVVHLARWGGVFLVSAAVFAVNVLIAELIGGSRWPKRALVGLAAIAIVVAPQAIGVGVASADGGPRGTPLARPSELDIAAVQPNVPRGRFTSLGRRGRIGPEDTVIVSNAVRATAEIPADDPPDVVVWPENTLDRDPFTHPEVGDPTAAAIARLGSTFLVGAILDDGPDHFRNSVLVYGPDGVVRDRYDKVHLVPFGEYVPLSWARRVVPALDAELPHDGTPGRKTGILHVGRAPGSVAVGALICFESTYPEMSRALARAGADAIVVTTNDASFGQSAAARQHLDLGRMRAIETGRYVVQAAISGISAVVRPDGSIQAEIGLWQSGLLRERIPLASSQTTYVRYGMWIEIGIGAVAALLTLLALARRKEPSA
jgi:apolipoprotein N-acyltransferase